MQSKLSVLGIYNYLMPEVNIFDGLALPENELVSKNDLVNNILMRSAEFECIYPDGNFLPFAITNWWNKYSRTINKWIELFQLKYNPIENYDRMEEWSDRSKGINTSKSEAEGTMKDFISAFDSDTQRPNSSNDSKSKSKDVSAGNNENIHKGRVHGNVGVTTSAQMVTSEVELARFNLIEQITDLFIQEFCILVY